MARLKRHRRHNIYRPNKELNLKEQMVQKMMSSLYLASQNYWHHQLIELTREVKELRGREGNVREYGIHFNAKAWFVPWMGADQAHDFQIMPIPENMPELDAKATEITEKLGELDEEMYEANRFLINLLTFRAPSEIFKEFLGNVLYGKMSEFFERFDKHNKSHEDTGGAWTEHTRTALKTYTDDHEHVMQAMAKRVMFNLIASDAMRVI